MPIIRIEDIARLRFAAPDLSIRPGFLEDFGLNCFDEGGRLYGRGSDGRPFVHVTAPGGSGLPRRRPAGGFAGRSRTAGP
jgi:hypothetical protein